VAEGPDTEGLFGSESAGEKEPAAGGSADALALAAALQRSPDDADLARAASDYLVTQKRLVQLQIQHVDEELRLAIAAAKRKRYSDRVRNTFATLVALLVLGLVLAAVRMTVEALRDHSLVVESFTVPADLVAQGLSGEAVADSLVSRLADIRETANLHSLNFSEEVRASQARVVRVEIPQTGISLDELEHFVHRWLGHEVFASGVVRAEPGDALAITLHIAGALAIDVKGPRADLDHLLQETAERAFESFDRLNYVIYLFATHRPADAYKAAERVVQNLDLRHTSRKEAANAYALLGASDPDDRRGLARALVGIDLDPSVMTGWVEAAGLSAALGHDQAAYDFYQRVLHTRIEDQLPQQRGAYPHVMAVANFYLAQTRGDFAAFEGDYGNLSRSVSDLYARRARLDALLHDETRAAQDFAQLRSAGGTDEALDLTRWYVSSAKADWASALAAAQALIAAESAQKAQVPDPAFAAPIELRLQTIEQPRLAEAELMLGNVAAAALAVEQSPLDCYACVQLRARIAAAHGDWTSANRWFAAAVRQAPGLPAAYWRWGESLLAAGEFAGAAHELSLAHERGPHFADALKCWGDALVKQGEVREALKKYDEALKYAPNWATLKNARAAAARQLG
jgi:tetratricopeptide (TPR) repeat protein